MAREIAGSGYIHPFGEHHFDPISSQHFQRAGQSRHRERVSIHAEKQRAIVLLLLSVKANSLTDGKDVPFVKSYVEG